MSFNYDEKTMTECETVSEKIFEFASGELSSDDTNTVEKHVENCEKCAAELENARNLLGLIGESRVSSEKSVADAVMARIRRIKFAERMRRFSKLTVAAAVVLMVSVTVLINQGIGDNADGGAVGQDARIVNHDDFDPEQSVADGGFEVDADETTDAETEENL